jgi:O-antigen/teichoic acid export membrane protein
MASQVRRNILVSYANRASALIGLLVLVPLYARFLGPRLYGEWIVITSIVPYLALAGLGIDQTLTNRIAEALAANQQSEVRTLISTAFFAYTAIAVALATAMALFSPTIARVVISRTGAQAGAALLIVAVLYSIALPGNAFINGLRGFERVDTEQTIGVFTLWARNCGVAAAILSGLELIPLALLYGFAIVARNVAAYFRASRLSPEMRPRLSSFSLPTLRSLVTPSFAFFILQIGGVIGFGIDNLVIGYALKPEDVTHYAVPFSVIMTAAGLFATISMAISPTLTSGYARSQTEFLRRSLTTILRFALYYVTAGLLVFWIAGQQLLRIWAGPAVYPGNATYHLQLALFAIQVLIEPSYLMLVSTTHHYGTAAVHVFESALNLVLSLWWVKYWGLTGVIAGTVAARLVSTGWYIPMATIRVLGMKLHDFAGPVVRGGAVAVVAMLSVCLADGFYGNASLGAAVSLAIAALLLFSVIFAAVSLTRSERHELFSRLMKLVPA